MLQNIGGIANLTAIPAGAHADEVMAFDTGPGNMVMDALAQKLFEKSSDRNGAIANKGCVLRPVSGRCWAIGILRRVRRRPQGAKNSGVSMRRNSCACRRVSRKPEDALATATALTAESIALSYELFVLPSMRSNAIDYIVSGGGARNRTLMTLLKRDWNRWGVRRR